MLFSVSSLSFPHKQILHPINCALVPGKLWSLLRGGLLNHDRLLHRGILPGVLAALHHRVIVAELCAKPNLRLIVQTLLEQQLLVNHDLFVLFVVLLLEDVCIGRLAHLAHQLCDQRWVTNAALTKVDAAWMSGGLPLLHARL